MYIKYAVYVYQVCRNAYAVWVLECIMYVYVCS